MLLSETSIKVTCYLKDCLVLLVRVIVRTKTAFTMIQRTSCIAKPALRILPSELSIKVSSKCYLKSLSCFACSCYHSYLNCVFNDTNDAKRESYREIWNYEYFYQKHQSKWSVIWKVVVFCALELSFILQLRLPSYQGCQARIVSSNLQLWRTFSSEIYIKSHQFLLLKVSYWWNLKAVLSTVSDGNVRKPKARRKGYLLNRNFKHPLQVLAQSVIKSTAPLIRLFSNFLHYL